MSGKPMRFMVLLPKSGWIMQYDDGTTIHQFPADDALLDEIVREAKHIQNMRDLDATLAEIRAKKAAEPTPEDHAAAYDREAA